MHAPSKSDSCAIENLSWTEKRCVDSRNNRVRIPGPAPLYGLVKFDERRECLESDLIRSPLTEVRRLCGPRTGLG